MGSEFILLVATLVVALVDVALGIARLYYSRYNKKTWEGSVEYWTSWEKRKFDVAAQVLKEMGIESPEDLKKLSQVLGKEKKERKRKNER